MIPDTPDPNDEYRLLCADWSDKDMHDLISGSAQTHCNYCNKELLIAPSGIQVVIKYKAKVICSACAAKTPGDVTPPTPEQLEELFPDTPAHARLTKLRTLLIALPDTPFRTAMLKALDE